MSLTLSLGKDAALVQVAALAPRVPFDKFLRKLVWKQGEHFALIGPTGQGKTTMLTALLPKHPYVVVFATKPRDDSMTRLANHGYTIYRKWRNDPAKDSPRRILWPDARNLDSIAVQREVFTGAIARIYREGGWTIAIDELWYMSKMLNMDRDMKLLLLQGRSAGISLLAATQRPVSVPLEFYDQSTHLMFWRDNDEQNLARISGINYRNSSSIRTIVSNLEPHQVLYVNTRTGQMLRTRAPKPS